MRFTEYLAENYRECLNTLNETQDQLDISILAADKYITSDSRLKYVLDTPCTIEAKTDGIKLTVLKIADTGSIDDYIFAYKNSILYAKEFDYQTKTAIKHDSIGNSQFKLVFEHFEKLGKNSIPVNTELQIEYLMSKPTLSSNYTHKHGMVLIGYSKSTYTADFGILKTHNSGMFTEKRDEYAKELKINTPLKIFDGVLSNFERGIIAKDLKSIFVQYKNSLNLDNINDYWTKIKEMLLKIPSVFGGTEEGIVIKYPGMLLKVQQVYQVDQNARAKIKQKYRADSQDTEDEYWKNVRRTALELVAAIKVTNIAQGLEDAALRLKRLKLDFTHPKKCTAVIKDDIQGNVKSLIIKSMKGNNGCLVLGKFRVFTLGHYKLIKAALKKFDRVAVCLVTSKDTAGTEQLRLKMLQAVSETFGDKVQIIEHSSGNLFSIFKKCPFNINGVYAGTDRVQSYQKMLKDNLGMHVCEVQRNDEDISATKVIANIHDEKFFKKNTPKEIHEFYDELVKIYG